MKRGKSRFFSQVQDINRGLDNAAEMNVSGRLDKLQQEFNRNCLKAGSLVETHGDQPSLFKQALTIVDRKANQSWWRYAPEVYYAGAADRSKAQRLSGRSVGRPS